MKPEAHASSYTFDPNRVSNKFEYQTKKDGNRDSIGNDGYDSRTLTKHYILFAKDLIKDLKAKGISNNQIFHTLVNRVRLSVDDANALLSGKEPHYRDNMPPTPQDQFVPPAVHWANTLPERSDIKENTMNKKDDPKFCKDCKCFNCGCDKIEESFTRSQFISRMVERGSKKDVIKLTLKSMESQN
jgi:hypothetical protein